MISAANLATSIVSARAHIRSSSSALVSAQNNLSSSTDELFAVADKIEQRLKELAEREESLRTLDAIITQRNNELNDREQQFNEKEKELERKNVEVSAKLAKWAETEQRMATNVAKFNSLVHFNVGGKRFTATKEDLLKHKGSYFEEILTTSHVQMQSNGEIFIDRDRTLFAPVFDFLKTNKLKAPMNYDEYIALEAEFKYFKISFPLLLLPMFWPRGSVNTSILTVFEQYTFTTWLPSSHFHLLYKATRDGFDSKDFHKMCDDKGATLVVIQSQQGHLFGGYAPLSWDTSGNYKTHPDCFLFTLSNPNGIPPTTYHLKADGKNGIHCSKDFGAARFGGGYDIGICSNANRNLSYVKFPFSYVDTTGKGKATFTGEDSFITQEVEVYSVKRFVSRLSF